MSHPTLTAEEHAALAAFAKRHGRTWKARLNEHWMKASAAPELHRLRNSHGPSWLASFRFEERAPDA